MEKSSKDGGSAGGSAGSSGSKQMSMGQAAFLLLRVRKVIKKKLATKKEKAEEATSMSSSRGEGGTNKISRMRFPAPLIRSRTVPAIIVPFSILQAQLQANNNNTLPETKVDPPTPPVKSDFSTPGVDFIQFLPRDYANDSPPPAITVTASPCLGSKTSHSGANSPNLSYQMRKAELSNNSSTWSIGSGKSGVGSGSGGGIGGGSGGGDGGVFIYPCATSSSSSAGLELQQIKTSSQSSLKGLQGKFSKLHRGSGVSQNLLQPSTSSSQGKKKSFAWLMEESPSEFVDQTLLDSLVKPHKKDRRRSLENEDIEACRNRAMSFDTVSFFNKGTQKISPAKRRQTYAIGFSSPQTYPQGFLTAVVQGNVSEVKKILETTDVDLNSFTEDGLWLLDVAVIQRNAELVKLLLAYGAKENQYRKECLGDELQGMVVEAEKKSEDLMAKILKCSTFGNLSSIQLKELEKEFHSWEKRYKKLRKMKVEYAQIRPPDPPEKACIDVIGRGMVKLRVLETNVEDSIVTKYKIEWSHDPEFCEENNVHQIEVFDLKKMETTVNGLPPKSKAYFRVSVGNCKGYSMCRITTPFSIIPASWRDLEEVTDEEVNHHKGRYGGKTGLMEDLLVKAKSHGTHNVSPSQDTQPDLGPNKQRNRDKIISIRNLFTTATKFQKHLRRGAYLSCVVYSEDKLLVTFEDMIPTLEVDETFPSSSIHSHFHWLHKVACTWSDAKSLKYIMEKSASASALHFRLKLLQAATSMQAAIGCEDLGRLYHKIIRDKNGCTAVISIVNYLKSTKMISCMNARWVPLSKISSRKYTDDVSDVLMASIQDQILYHQVSNIPLGKGLYLGYLKLASSMDVLKIFVPEKTPNVLPHVKIRDNPHVSREEWELMKNGDKGIISEGSGNEQISVALEQENSEMGVPGLAITSTNEEELSECQQIFQKQLSAALKRITSLFGVDVDTSSGHRFYNMEVIEMSSNVCFLVVFPSADNVCLLAGQSDPLLQRNDLTPLPIQIFEMIHLGTYQKELINRYSRLSTVLEMDATLAYHNQREAFSSDEVAAAKQRVSSVEELQKEMESNWKSCRWLMDLITSARGKDGPSITVNDVVLPTIDATKNSSESITTILSADAAIIESEMKKLKGHSGFNALLPTFPEGQMNGLKFSKSDNQLTLLGTGSTSSLHPDSILGPSAERRKVSMPTTSSGASVIDMPPTVVQRLSFSLSQSDSTIAIVNPASSYQIHSASLHNLYKQQLQQQQQQQQGSKSPDGSCDPQQDHKANSQLTVSSSSRPCSPSKGRRRSHKQENPETNPTATIATAEPTVMSNVHPPLSVRKSNPIPPPVPPRRGQIPGSPNFQRASSNREIPIPSSSSAKASMSGPSDGISKGGSMSSLSKIAPLPPRVRNVASSPIASVDFSSTSSIPAVPKLGIPSDISSVMEVYSAYESGLPYCTCIRLQVTPQTTSKQIVDLFVEHLKVQVEKKGLYCPEYSDPDDFCLVSVIGTSRRERVLRTDFRPYMLQEPWRSGRFYIRRKNEITAAVDADAINNTLTKPSSEKVNFYLEPGV